MKLIETYPTADTPEELERKELEQAETSGSRFHFEIPTFTVGGWAGCALSAGLLGYFVAIPIVFYFSMKAGIIMFCLMFVVALAVAIYNNIGGSLSSEKPQAGMFVLLATLFSGFLIWLLSTIASLFPRFARYADIPKKVIFIIACVIIAVYAVIWLIVCPAAMIASIIRRRIRCTERATAGIVFSYVGDCPQYSYVYNGQKYIYTIKKKVSGDYVSYSSPSHLDDDNYSSNDEPKMYSTGKDYGLSRQILIDPAEPSNFYDEGYATELLIRKAARILLGIFLLSKLYGMLTGHSMNLPEFFGII